jgi:predicted DNA-binding protein
VSSSLSIRLSDEARETLESAAREHGAGISTLVRDLAEAEARRIRTERTRAEGEKFMVAVRADSELAGELGALGNPQVDHPDSEAWWPAP